MSKQVEVETASIVNLPAELHISIAQYLAIRPCDLFPVLQVGPVILAVPD